MGEMSMVNLVTFLFFYASWYPFQTKLFPRELPRGNFIFPRETSGLKGGREKFPGEVGLKRVFEAPDGASEVHFFQGFIFTS